MTEVSLHREGNVGVISLRAPGRRNALTLEMARALIAVCGEVDRDASIGAVVVQGEGGHFCSGAHRALLADTASDPSHSDAYEAIGTVYEAFVRVGHVAVPSVAAVRGAAVGAGVNLMLATDLRVVATDARILSGFLRIGVHRRRSLRPRGALRWS